MLPQSADPYDVPASPQRAKDKAMATGTPIRGSPVVMTREKAVDGPKASPVPKAGTPKAGTPKASTPKTGTPTWEDKPTPKAAEPIDTRNGDKAVKENGDAAAAAFKEDVEIESFIGHAVDQDTSTVDIQVQWEGGETTWETEWSLQEQVPTLVFKYWDKLDGRESATGLDVYHVFKILKRTSLSKAKNPQYMYQVQWVGYRRTESTWEHESKLREIAPEELEKFEAKEEASSAAASAAQKRKAARGPGRPRKRTRAADKD
ncbi:hypothetical protein ACJ41O_003323 [Fusarium nematophilum]